MGRRQGDQPQDRFASIGPENRPDLSAQRHQAWRFIVGGFALEVDDDVTLLFLRVRFRSTYGAPVQFTEIEAYEEAGQPSVLEGRPLNIAAAGNGGAVALFTEPSND